MTLKEWLMAHVPAWLNPINPWGEKGRPHDPDLHALGNKQQEISLRLDRLASARGARPRRGASPRRGTLNEINLIFLVLWCAVLAMAVHTGPTCIAVACWSTGPLPVIRGAGMTRARSSWSGPGTSGTA
jgi:hypothetical protein